MNTMRYDGKTYCPSVADDHTGNPFYIDEEKQMYLGRPLKFWMDKADKTLERFALPMELLFPLKKR